MSRAVSRMARAVWAGFALTGSPASVLSGLQLSGVMDLGTGPVSWDSQESGGALTQGRFGAAYRIAPFFGLQPELVSAIGVSTDPAERTAVGWDLGVRLHTQGRVTGGWLGFAAGGAGTGTPKNALTRLEGGIRRAIGPAGLNVWVTRTTFGAGLTPRGPLGQDSAPQLDTLVDNRITEYTDVGSRATLGLGRHELGFLVIQRLGGPAIRRTAWELSGVWWVSAGVGVVGATGHSLPQFGLTVPAARYGTLGLRLALGAQPRHREKARRERDVRAAMTPRVVLAPAGRLSFVGVNGTIGEVMGDFTDWEPRRLVRSGEGRWTVPLVLSPGVHHLNVRFDGGGWLVPEGAVAVDDGFGGRVGLIVVR